jgi:hypothetical protein
MRSIVQAFAELRYGAVVHTRENSVKYGHNLGHTPFTTAYTIRPTRGPTRTSADVFLGVPRLAGISLIT